MKLQDKFFHSFFYPFLVGVLLSMIITIIFLAKFTNNYFDQRTGKNIVELEKKYVSININSINILLTTSLLKIQASLNEQILFYLKLANKTNEITHYDINNFLQCLLNINEEFIKKNKNNLEYTAFWFIDENTTEEDLEIDSPEYIEILLYSNILQNVYSSLVATKSFVVDYFFFF